VLDDAGMGHFLGAVLRECGVGLRDRDAIDALFRTYGAAIELVIHTAAQPSHDWAAREPFTDFDINAVGTLNLLEATRLRAPGATFIFTSTNKVYGDTPNRRSAAELHGFLAYVIRCIMTRKRYTVFGYKGKQVRDAIHSRDLISAFDAFFRAPHVAEVYNIGGKRFSNASVLEAIELSEEIAGERLDWTYEEANRIGDHIWSIGDNGRFESHYPDWKLEYDVRRILEEMHEANAERWLPRV
jgi:nucleoside-diphosphate-sugar epimerase